MPGTKLSMQSLLAATALLTLALAGCAKRAPESLPPAPPTAGDVPDAASGGGAEGGIGSAALPGAAAGSGREALVAAAGTDRVRFGYDSYELDEAARAVLDAQAQWLLRNPTTRITIEGHADERGTREYNLALGERRAGGVRNYLASRGVDAGRIAIISFGKERPEVEGSDEAAWALNRRGVTVVEGGGRVG